MKNWSISLLIGLLCVIQSDYSDAQARIPGWNRVAPPGGHQNDPQLVRATGGPVVPIFEGWFPNPDERARLESGTTGVSISERSTGTSQYSQR